MKLQQRMFTVATLSGMIGGIFGSLADSNLLLVNILVAAIISLIAAYSLKGMIR